MQKGIINVTNAKISETGTEIAFNTNIPAIPIIQYETLSPVEYYKRQLDLIIKDHLKALETKKYLIAFIKVYGKDYKQKVLDSGICTSMDSLANYEKELRVDNLLIGYWPDAIINPGIVFQEAPILLINGFFLDPNETFINHKNFQRTIKR